ncbi:MAG: cytochrome c oxidase subunit II [Solirubrobacterales bacterium]
MRLRIPLLLTALAALAALAAPASATAGPLAPGGSGETTVVYWLLVVFGVGVIVAVHGALLVTARRFRARRGYVPRQLVGGPGTQRRLAVGAGALAAGLLVVGVVSTAMVRDQGETGPNGLELSALAPQRNLELPAGKNDPLVIQVAGQQWLWRFAYPNPDDDRSFPETFSYRKLVVPVDTLVELRVISTDVVHNFWVPELGPKIDAIPGKLNTVSFVADEEGVYEGHASVLSGDGYPTMGIEVEVVSPAKYQQFVARKAEEITAAQTAVQRALDTGERTPGGGGSVTQDPRKIETQPKEETDQTIGSQRGGS